ncbi:opacity family porin [Moraxella sp. VT-16-12]|uniref:opacity family porin n=1 Tax=Moraxella sp. VT-16-12 TaxID=2014877 RepID=UPI000B7FB4D4|nr:opacity family porin [Moraxella sp. VT-16-12]TWV82994.1 outer membrane beta-barrel protein [Moraxella sp. VT-16-12]
MKKFILATLLAIPALATAQNGYYVQADVGYARVKVDGVSGGDDTISYGVAVGKAMDSGARFAVDYTHIANGDFNQKGTNFKMKAHSVGASAIYDFKNDTPLTPYLGVKASATRLSGKGDGHHSKHVTRTGMGAVAGVQYQVAPNLALDGAVEYNYLGKFEGQKVTQYGAKAGVRMDF